jgi:60S ribosome subunit biogenesis protein NIP7
MRQLTEEEMRVFFTKLSQWLGDNIRFLIDRPDEPYVFRLHEERLYYLSESLFKIAENVGREELIGAGTCFGKFTKADKFRLHITALDYLAKYARYKVWVKPGGEQAFLYGNHVLKTHLAKVTENTPQYAGVVVYNMQDVALGFGVIARNTDACAKLHPQDIVVFNQADLGEYIRSEQLNITD